MDSLTLGVGALLLWLIFHFVCAIGCGFLAGEKNRSGTAHYFWGLLFGIVWLLVCVGLPSLPPKSR